MKIIKVWYLNTELADNTTDYLHGGYVHNRYTAEEVIP